MKAQEAWAAASFHQGWEAEEIQKGRANVRALLGPMSECVVSSTVESGDVLSPDERGYRTVSWTTWTLIVHGRPARSNSWLSSHDKIPGGEISLQDSDFADGRAPEAVLPRVILRLREQMRTVMMRNAPGAFQAEWAELVAAQIATWAAEDAVLIAAAHATWAEQEHLALEADDIKEEANRFLRLPSGNEVGEPPTRFDSWHSPVEELREMIVSLRAWLIQAEEMRQGILRARGEREIAAKLAEEERLAAIAKAMSAPPATPAPWFIGDGVDLAEIEASTGRKRGEGLGDKLAGSWESRYLPGDRSLVALHVTSGGGSRYRCVVTTKGLVALTGGGIPEEVYGRRAQELLAAVVEDGWYVVERFFKDGITTSYVVTTARGTATVYPDDQPDVRSHGWNHEGSGPTATEVCKILGLKWTPTSQVEEPPPAPPQPPAKPTEPPKPATPAAVAATLVGLQGKFGKKR